MVTLPLGGHSESPADSYSLLMEQPENVGNSEHVIDITRGTDAAVTTSTHDASLEPPSISPSIAMRAPESLPSVASAYVNNSTNLRRGDSHRRRSPLNSGLWMCIELLLTISQIVASIVVLALSKYEEPHAPLRAWIVGYASGCVAVLPLPYWRYRHRNQFLEHESNQNSEISVQGTLTTGTGLSLSFTRPSVEVNRQTVTATEASSGSHRFFQGLSARLCVVFLTLSCIGYATLFILCAICCCLPCIISVLGFRENLNQRRKATLESINALPTYKFKLKKNKSGGSRDNSGVEGGVVAAGTDKERVISAEDAACCICLARYTNNDELRELPCSHFLHKDCVDKWLKIKASCPLCKCEIGAAISNSNTSHEATESGVAN